jgi:formylglycine-generating enzyme required for sulfatase activity
VQERPGQQQTGTSGAAAAAATPSGLRQPELPPTVVGKDGAEMVLVPAGEFVMGSAPDDIASLLRLHPKANSAILKDEIPRHRVFLEAFYMDKYEVTNARFQQFVQATGYQTQAENKGGGKIRTGAKTWAQVPDATWRAPQGQGSSIAGLEAHPVVQVSWHDATAYCTWAGKRLPTEAEWEKAARGTEARLYPWGNEVDGTRVNFCDLNCPFEWKEAAVNDGYRSTAPVGSYEAGKSLYGAYDMAGNVWEWVADRYVANYYRRSPARNPRGPTSGTQVVLRGGSWLYAAPSFRTTERAGVPADRRNENIGLRCAQTP